MEIMVMKKIMLMIGALLVASYSFAHESSPTLVKDVLRPGKYVGKTSWFSWNYNCSAQVSTELARDGSEIMVVKIEGDRFEQNYNAENKGLPIQFWTNTDGRVVSTAMNHQHWLGLANYYSREGEALEGNFMLHLTFTFKHQSDSVLVPDYFSVVVGRESKITNCSYLKKVQ